MRRATATALALFGTACLLAVPTRALADTVAFQDDGSLPWASGPGATSPLEGVLGTIASTIAGRGVSIRCEGDFDWGTLLSERRLPATVLGYVAFYGFQPIDFAEVAPTVCVALQQFGLATTKPTECPTTTTVQQPSTKTVRTQLKKRVKTKGRWHTTTVWVTHEVTSFTSVTVPGPAVPCYTSPSTFEQRTHDDWATYFTYAQALQVIAHESIHLSGHRSEAEAECLGMQRLASVAVQLGDSAVDAQGIASFYANVFYPSRAGTPYGSTDCRQGGPLDQTPTDGVWP